MAITSTQPRKIVIEWRYKHNLAFFREMDAVGQDLSDEFPDWQRTGHALQLENKDFKRRCHLHPDRTVFESDFESDALEQIDTNLKCAGKAQETTQKHFKFNRHTRFGMRFWFALSVKHDFDYMVARIQKRFYEANDRVETILGVGAKVEDLAYIMDLGLDETWKCHFKLGPMRRKEWFERIPYERRLFPSSGAFESFVESFPDPLLYVDIDYYREDVDSHLFDENVREAKARADSTIKNTIDYYLNG